MKERHLGALMCSLARLRSQEENAVRIIQRCFRGFSSRGIVKALRLVLRRRTTEQQTPLFLQPLYRGHYGRKRFEIHKEMRKQEIHAKTLLWTTSRRNGTAAERSGTAALTSEKTLETFYG